MKNTPQTIAISQRMQEVIHENIGEGKVFDTEEYFFEMMKLVEPEDESLKQNEESIGFRQMLAIHVTCGVNIEWLVTGNGKKYRDDMRIKKTGSK